MNKTLSPRLLLVASYAQRYRRIADIGSDHALLPLFLLADDKIDYALCVEVAPGPYDINARALSPFIEAGKARAILSFGIDDVTPETVDAVVIAGMGGLTIIDILRRDIPKAQSFKSLILQPQNAQDEVRRFLLENQLAITDEAIAREKDKFYEVICAAFTPQPLPKREDIYYEIPLLCVRNAAPHTLDFILHKQSILQNILAHTLASSGEKAAQIRTEALKKHRKLEEVKQCLSKSSIS